MAKGLELQLQHQSSNDYSGLISFRIDWLDLFAVQGTLIGDWNAKLGSQDTPGVTGKFCHGIQNEAGQRLIEFCQENALVIANKTDSPSFSEVYIFEETRKISRQK